MYSSRVLSIVLPTFNEAANVPLLLERIRSALHADSYEVIVVDDDSPDQTWKVAEELTTKHPELRVVRRIDRRGLSSAVTEGFREAKGDVLLVMDADLQHDPSTIARLLEEIVKGADIAVASRYIEGGTVGHWVRGRRILSKTATFLARKLPPVEVSDPMSGFFAIRREAFAKVAPFLKPSGFKILLEILTFLPKQTRTAEVPLQFQARHAGKSKLSVWVEMQFLWQLLRILLLRTQKMLFWGAILLVLLLTLPRAWALRPLYLDAQVRTQTEQSLRFLADTHGWLLSDLAVQRVERDSMTVLHRSHHRGPDEQECLLLFFVDHHVAPCI